MEILLASIIAFASTNIDDIFILTLFFGDKSYKSRDIYIGQYVGISLLLILAVAGSVLGSFLEARYIGLLGLFPIYLGMKQLILLFKSRSIKEEDKEQLQKVSMRKSGIMNVAAVTFANGGDNIGIYIPLFASLSLIKMSVMIAIFYIMVLIWLLTAKYLTTHPAMASLISKYGHILTPIVLCAIGFFILYENGTFTLFR